MRKMKKGFTLAEVLIALTIIGVVAALTIPTLVQKTNKQEYVSALQKAYSTLSQATNMIIAENGSPKGDEGWAKSNDSVYQMYKKHLNNLKDCAGGTGCTFPGSYKYLFNGEHETWENRTELRKLVLSDGVQLIIGWTDNGACTQEAHGSTDYCALIHADLNGEKKPNQYGRDFFVFVLKENGVFPMGCDLEVNNCLNGDKSGAGCACRVIREGKMDY